ncbi:glycosyltransferase family 2 protein [Thetidibacter halocola]|uniref:Glycosyltransferase family 2 protein n=1 Tax=Thetidibacter halocola TaxID=2827239 RepID=A0A8J7WJ38_9RHOB|nr:glycosyltransferase family 2 protein [Thetidibacter halocola]MBS0126176.1 glycosyltransferase family 2 protein [Thetidibacter halocola]
MTITESFISNDQTEAAAQGRDSTGGTAPVVAIIVPMHNEEDAVLSLVEGIAEAGRSLPSFEIIAVDDGSTDRTADRLAEARTRHPQLRILRHARAGGQSAAVHSGVRAARAPFCLTLDGDGQNPPEELPGLFAPLSADKTGRVGLVAGQRVGRKDTLSKRLASKFANGLRARVLRDGTRDTGCGLKGFRRDAFLALPYFDHMHRYLPALFKAQGWEVALVDVSHKARISGRSKYTNLQRAIAGAWDLLGVVWLLRRAKKVAPEEV